MTRPEREILEEVARQHIPDNVDIYPAVLERLRRTPRDGRRWRWAIALAMALLLLAGMVYAMGRSRGYLPGLGLVHPGVRLRVLAAPVEQMRQGVRVRVEKGVTDDSHTVIVVQVSLAEGYRLPTPPTSERPRCLSTPVLRLSDGRVLEIRGGGGGAVERWIFPPLPRKASEVELDLPCLNGLPPGTPSHWHFTLRFVPPPPNLTLVPVATVDFPTPTPAPTGTPTMPSAPITMQAIALDGKYILFGRLQHAVDGWVTLKRVTVTDAKGREVPLLPAPMAELGDADWGVAFSPQGVQFPVAISFQWAQQTFRPLALPVVVPVTVGSPVKGGQTWHPRLTLTLGQYEVALETVRAVGNDGYQFVFRVPAVVSDLALNVEEGQAVGGSGEESPRQGGSLGGTVTHTIIFSRRPEGTLHLKLTGLLVSLPVQKSRLSWAPPPDMQLPATPGAIAQSEKICLDAARWQRLLASPLLLPALLGKMVYSVQSGGMLPWLYVSRPDGSERQQIGAGAWPALSPDGSRLLYSASAGWRLRDLTTGKEHPLPGDGRHPIWSPDGKRVLFGQGLGLYVLSLVTGKRDLITQGVGGPVEPVGWSQDGRSVLYAALEMAFHLRQRDLHHNIRRDLGLRFDNKAGYATVSPDGRWVAFADRSGGASWGVYIAHPDGTDKRLIVSSEVKTTFVIAWSPDGRWLVVNTLPSPQAPDKETARPVVVNPFTCETHVLPFQGVVEDWGP